MKKICSGAYKIYKILPLISAALTVFFSFVFGIADAATEITELGDELEIGAIIVWMLIGGILAVINFFATVILISPTIVRTDAVLDIKDAASEK